MGFRVGLGYDLHRLEPGRPLVLGGVEIPFGLGLAGHSDGDALVHALIDALLGAAGEPDIGELFPDTEPRWRGARSVDLLREVVGRLAATGAAIENVDVVVAAEAPRLAPYKDRMRSVLGPVLGLPPGRVGIKAKTNEGTGAVGRGEAVACWAVALLRTGGGGEGGKAPSGDGIRRQEEVR